MKRETYKQLMPGLHFGAHDGGWMLLIKLGKYGLNLGSGFSGYWSLRSWEWARYDFTDHFTYLMFGAWSVRPETLQGGN